MTKFLNNADIKGYIAQTAVTSYLLKADSTGRLVAAIAGTDYQAPTTALLPSGGTAGQILAKIDGTNYNTQWIDNYTPQVKHDVKLGAALSKGTPVYVSNANGTNMIVSAASNASEATSSKTLGLLESGGVLNDTVKVVTEGLLAGLDTSTATAGDPVWLGPSGTLLYGLANKPVAPVHMVFIGIVTRVQSNNGEIFVKVQNGFELEELHNVALSSVADGQGLFYESATNLWKNKTIAAVLGYTPANGANYLPLTGGTLTGALSGTSATFSGLTVDNNQNASTWIIAKNQNAGSGAAAGFLMTNNTGDLGAISLLSSGNSPANGLFIRTLSTNSLILGTNSTANLTIANGGATTFSSSVTATKLALNTTVSSSTLEVLGTNSQWAGSFTGNSSASSSYGVVVVAGTNSNDIAFRVNNAANSSTYFNVRGDGNVGIGTTSPAGKLSTYGGEIGTQITFTKDSPSGAYGRLGQDSNGTFLTQNAKWDGTSWTRDNTGGVPMALALHNGNGRYEFRIAANGANPISWTNALVIESNAAATFAGSLTANGTFNFAATGNVLFTSNDANNYARFTGNSASAQIGLFRASDGGMYIGGAAAGFRVFDSSFNTRLLLAPGGQLQLNTYTSATSYSGTAAGYLAFDSSGNVITVAGVAATDNTKLPLAGGTMTGALVVSAGDRGFEVNASGGISLYSNEINAGALGGTGTIYLGWRRTSQINVGVPISSNSTIAAIGAISTTVAASAWGFLATTSGYSNGSGIWFSTNVGELLLRKADGTLSTRISADGTNAFINNNNILHAGNYNSYSPTLTGGGASGTWGINVTGSSRSLLFSGDSAKAFLDGLWAGGGSYPGYQFTGGNSRFGFSSTGGVVDVYADGNFYATDSSHLVLHAGNYNSYSPTLTGGGASGTWGINISGTATYANNASGGFTNTGTHGSSFIQNELPASANGAGTGRVVLRQWCSEPGVTWDWAGFGYNVSNDNGSPAGFGRFNTSFGQAYMRFSTSGDLYFYNTTTGGTRTQSMLLSSVGNASFSGKISNGSVWINNGVDNNSYNENIRLFAAPNGVSVIAFNASGTSGTPSGGSILGFDDRLEFRKGGDAWQLRIFSGNVEASGSFRAPIFYDSNDTGYYLDPNATGTALRLGGNIFANGSFGTNGYGSGALVGRVFAPKGATFSLSAYANITGAIKIRLPQRANDTMWSMKVRIYNYNAYDTSEYLLGNYSYSAGAWNYSATYLGGTSSVGRTVRFGNEGGYDCVWIGETSTGWVHPVVSVMDFMGGYSNGSCENWDDNWDITIVSAFGNVGAAIAPNINFNEAYSYSYRGNGNVAGTGSASYHPSGIYSTGTNWLYGTMYLNNNTIYDANNIYNSGWFRNNSNLQGLYNQAVNQHFYASGTFWNITTNGGSDGGLIIRTDHQSTIKGYLFYNSSGFGLLNNSGDWAIRTNYGGSNTGGELYGSWSINTATSGATLTLGAVDNSRTYNDTLRHGLVINAPYYPHIDVNATANSGNPTHGPVISMTGVKTGGGYRRWGMGIANVDPGYFSIGWYDNEANPHYGVGHSWSLGGRFVIDTAGNIWCTGDITAYGAQSDARLKIIKGKVPNALEGILKLNGYRFDWKERDVKITTFVEDIGVVAQEVAEVFPELAREGEDGWMSVRYQGLTAVLIEAVKEQQKQIEELKSIINDITK